MRAAGISAWRFIMPAAAASFVIGLLTITLLNPLTTAMTAKFETERDRIDTTMANRPGGARPQPQAAKGQKTAEIGDR